MTNIIRRYTLAISILFLLSTSLAISQQTTPNSEVKSEEKIYFEDDFSSKALKVFIELRTERLEFLKQEVQFVNYVRDRAQADLIILETTRRNSTGGNEYTYTFIGQNKYRNMNDTLVYSSMSTDSEMTTRNGIIKTLKQGVLPYVKHTPQYEHLEIRYSKETISAPKLHDSWNNWVFNARVNTRLNGNSNEFRQSYNGSFSADRVTEDIKIGLSLSANYNEDKYDYPEYDYKYTSIQRSQNFRTLVVKSINDHWSYGAYADVNTSQFSNIRLEYAFEPAIEFNVFPYSVSTRRELRFLYKVGVKNVNYFDETIYNKTKETLYVQSITGSFELKEEWGSLFTNVSFSNFLNDLEKYDLSFFSNFNIKIFQGFSIDINGSYSETRDQLNIRKGDVSQEDILLKQKQIASAYSYRVSFGVRYTFGSMFSNVVNPRFGSGGNMFH